MVFAYVWDNRIYRKFGGNTYSPGWLAAFRISRLRLRGHRDAGERRNGTPEVFGSNRELNTAHSKASDARYGRHRAYPVGHAWEGYGRKRAPASGSKRETGTHP